MSQNLIGIIVVNGGLALIVLMVIGIVFKVLLTICLLLMYFINYIITFIPIKIKKYFYKKRFLIKKIIIILIILALGKISYNIYNIEDNLTLEEKIKIMFMDVYSSKKYFVNDDFELNINSSLGFYEIFDATYSVGRFEYNIDFLSKYIVISQYNIGDEDLNLVLRIDNNKYDVYINNAKYSMKYIETVEKQIEAKFNKIYDEYIVNTYDNGLKSKKYFWVNYFEAKLDL